MYMYMYMYTLHVHVQIDVRVFHSSGRLVAATLHVLWCSLPTCITALCSAVELAYESPFAGSRITHLNWLIQKRPKHMYL